MEEDTKRYEIVEHTIDGIRKQFKEICDYLKYETNTIIPDDLSGVYSIELSIKLEPNEIIRIVRTQKNNIDMSKGEDNYER